MAIFRYYTPIGGVEGPNGYPINRPIQSDSKNTLGTILEVCISKRLTDIPKDTQLLRALFTSQKLSEVQISLFRILSEFTCELVILAFSAVLKVLFRCRTLYLF